MQTIFRTVLTSHFTTLPNAMLRDKTISFRARGLLAMVLSNTNEWEVHHQWLQAQATEGPDAIRAAMRQLEDAGYVVYKQSKSSHQRFTKAVWTFYDTPVAAHLRSNHRARGGGARKGTIPAFIPPPRLANPERGDRPTKKDYPKNDKFSLKRLTETSPPADDAVVVSKADQLKSIRKPNDAPTRKSFDAFIAEQKLDNISEKRPDLYNDLCAAKWHKWYAGENRWKRIGKWTEFVRALDTRIQIDTEGAR